MTKKPDRTPDALLRVDSLAPDDESLDRFIAALTGDQPVRPTHPGNEALESEFDTAMHEIYERAGSEVGYWATRYLQLLRRRGGMETARQLLGSPVTSDGYARLRDAGRLDLTVEALVLDSKWEPLFSADELRRAAERLAEYDAMPTATDLEPTPELTALVERANAASPGDRIAFRDGIAAYGPSAMTAVGRALSTGGSVALAIAVSERIGLKHRDLALAALLAIRKDKAGWETVIDAAVARLHNGLGSEQKRALTRLPTSKKSISPDARGSDPSGDATLLWGDALAARAWEWLWASGGDHSASIDEIELGLAREGVEIRGDDPRVVLSSAMNRSETKFRHPERGVWQARPQEEWFDPTAGLPPSDYEDAAYSAAREMDPQQRGFHYEDLILTLRKRGTVIRARNKGQAVLAVLAKSVRFRPVETRTGIWTWR